MADRTTFAATYRQCPAYGDAYRVVAAGFLGTDCRFALYPVARRGEPAAETAAAPDAWFAISVLASFDTGSIRKDRPECNDINDFARSDGSALKKVGK